LGRFNGVVPLGFHEDVHPLAMVVMYKPSSVSSEEVFAEVIKCDSQATMVPLLEALRTLKPLIDW